MSLSHWLTPLLITLNHHSRTWGSPAQRLLVQYAQAPKNTASRLSELLQHDPLSLLFPQPNMSEEARPAAAPKAPHHQRLHKALKHYCQHRQPRVQAPLATPCPVPTLIPILAPKPSPKAPRFNLAQLRERAQYNRLLLHTLQAQPPSPAEKRYNNAHTTLCGFDYHQHPSDSSSCSI